MPSSPRRPIAGVLGLLILLLFGLESKAAEMAERILAVADGMPVLLSEARLLSRLEGTDLDLAREALVDELLMHREAARLPQAAVSSEEVSRIVADIEARHPGLGAAAGEQGVSRLARRQASILRYIAFRFRPQVRVTEEAVVREWRADHGGASGEPTEADLAPVRALLEKAALDARVEEWVADLRASARLRYNPSSGPPRS